MSWAPTKRSRAFWPTRSSTTEFSSVSASVGAGQVLLPDLGLGALLEHDQHAPVQRDVPSASEIAVSTIGASTRTPRGT